MKNLADEMFTATQRNFQRISALTFWLNRTVSAVTDVEVGDSLVPNPVGELDESLERLIGCATEWLQSLRQQ